MKSGFTETAPALPANADAKKSKVVVKTATASFVVRNSVMFSGQISDGTSANEVAVERALA